MMQRWENGQKPQFGQFFDDFKVKVKRDLISTIINFACNLPYNLPKDLRFRKTDRKNVKTMGKRQKNVKTMDA